MELITAKTAGFCFGVKRAVEQVYAQIEAGTTPIYTYGPIIHNQEVVNELEAKGVHVLAENHLEQGDGRGTVIIRSHGVSRQVQEQLTTLGYTVVDATCPFVKKIHRIVSEKSAEGYNVLIAGDPDHPEVQGIIGWCSGPVLAITEPDEIHKIPPEFLKKVCVVAQTTFNYNKFQLLLANLEKILYDKIVFNSICNATQERQIEAKQVASGVDCMLVVGDQHSSNTQKLFEICLQECNNTHFVETVQDLDALWFEDAKRVGITAGASTPHKIIEEVQTYVREF
jgi:4-hydroxy-3-methylbut-2-enyl diphosphate reductase